MANFEIFYDFWKQPVKTPKGGESLANIQLLKIHLLILKNSWQKFQVVKSIVLKRFMRIDNILI